MIITYFPFFFFQITTENTPIDTRKVGFSNSSSLFQLSSQPNFFFSQMSSNQVHLSLASHLPLKLLFLIFSSPSSYDCGLFCNCCLPSCSSGGCYCGVTNLLEYGIHVGPNPNNLRFLKN